jgi:hypothetical protein
MLPPVSLSRVRMPSLSRLCTINVCVGSHFSRLFMYLQKHAAFPKMCSCAFAAARSHSSPAVLPPAPNRAFSVTWLQKSLTAFIGPISAKFGCALQVLRREDFVLCALCCCSARPVTRNTAVHAVFQGLPQFFFRCVSFSMFLDYISQMTVRW